MSLHLYVVECYINMSSYGKNGHYEAISFIWAIKHNGMDICITHISRSPNMQYIYGSFTDKQITEAVRAMHGDIHKLLLYKDNTIEEKIFEDDEAFLVFFENVMFKLGGTKTLFNDNGLMVTLMATLQGAMDNFKSDHFSYKKFRRAILDSHGYIKQMFEGGVSDAESTNS